MVTKVALKERTLKEICEAFHAGECPHYAYAMECDWPERDCLECDPVAVVSRWLYPTSPREWQDRQLHRNHSEHWLAEVLKELRADDS